MLTMETVAAAMGWRPKTVRQYRNDSKAGRKYGDHPFPAPWRMLGRTPIWHDTQIEEIREWARTRTGQGNGGGRPAQTEGNTG